MRECEAQFGGDVDGKPYEVFRGWFARFDAAAREQLALEYARGLANRDKGVPWNVALCYAVRSFSALSYSLLFLRPNCRPLPCFFFFWSSFRPNPFTYIYFVSASPTAINHRFCVIFFFAALFRTLSPFCDTFRELIFIVLGNAALLVMTIYATALPFTSSAVSSSPFSPHITAQHIRHELNHQHRPPIQHISMLAPS
jgi:hypothetical protein